MSRSLIKDLRFAEGYNWEDMPYIMQVLAGTDKLAKTDSAYWAYRQRNESITHEKFSCKSLDLVHMAYERNMVVGKEFPRLSKLSAARFWITIMEVYELINISGNKEIARDLYRKVKKEYLPKCYSFSIVGADGISLSSKIALITLRFCFRGTCFVKRILYMRNKARRNR